MINSKKQSILSILLALSLCLNVGLLIFTSYKKVPGYIIGTYCTGNEMSEDDKYLVFQHDGSYVLYRQFELLEEGNYKPNGDSIYALISQDTAAEHSVIYHDGSDELFFVDSGSNVMSFHKISTTPTFVNLPEYKGNG